MTDAEGIRFVGADAIRSVISFTDLIEPTSLGFQQASAGQARSELVTMFPAESPDLGDVYVKTAHAGGHDLYIVKVSPWFRRNVDNGLPQGGFVAVFDAVTGHTRAMLDDQHFLSDIRTAAAGALAARALAPTRVEVATVVGAGVQAYWQPQALYQERRFRRLLIWARRTVSAEALAARLRTALPEVEISVADDLERAVRQADVLITATSSKSPIIRGDWLRPGQHITAVGADDPTKCELDADVLHRARVVVDSISATIANGDVHHAIVRDLYDPADLSGELGDVLAGRLRGRVGDHEITVATFVGIGIQDLVAAEETLHRLTTSPPMIARMHNTGGSRYPRRVPRV